ncbi:exopolysaccharide biosynthesis polyprenyl glycosylphosphotransferase [Nocardioides sp. C4-1]|uniref:exopolysaccharide biosynthesis polyprenyl glycosylphosphotransferase n=1 Tax=Nocardioides sp. C4-1 TaxID=3151851 RepID=UPI00326388EC
MATTTPTTVPRRSVLTRTLPAPLPPSVTLPAAARTPLARPPSARPLTRTLVDLTAAGVLSALLLASWPTVAPSPLEHALVAVVWVLLLSGARCNAPGPLPGGSGGTRRVLRASTALVAVLALAPAVVPGLVPDAPAPLPLLLLAAAVSAVAIAQRSHLASRRPGRSSRTRSTTAVVAGHARDVARVVSELGSDRRRSIDVAAVCVPATAKHAFDVPAVRGFDLLVSAVEAHGAEVAIVLPCHHFDPLTLRRLGWQLEAAGVHLVVGSGLIDVDRSRARTMRAGGLDLVHVRHAELTGGRRLLKQLWERPAAALALLLVSPLLAVVALAIRLESPGPAIFRQVRIGKDGEPFTMLKLRTMGVDAEDRRAGLTEHDGSGPLFKVRADPRVTRIGRILRRYSVDELPQLVNVARGEMSLVGPRPPLPDEVLGYDGDTLRRLAVRPGMTGLWQVSGRSDLPWDETVRLDLRYVDNWSLVLDAVIIVRTLQAVVGHRGAY